MNQYSYGITTTYMGDFVGAYIPNLLALMGI
jgi:hypothetical protein